MTVKTFLIAGGAGFIGSALIRHIINETISDNKLIENIASLRIELDESIISRIKEFSANAKPWSNPRYWQQ